MKILQFFLSILIILIFIQCTVAEEQSGREQSEGKVNTHIAYDQALKTISKIDSLNKSLEWKEIQSNVWVSNKGDYGIQESKMIYLDSMLFVTDYITEIDSIPLKNLIHRMTFTYVGNNYYKDSYHVYLYHPMAYGGTFSIFDTAHVESFQKLGDCYAQDLHHVYSEKGEILKVDYNTFYTSEGAGCFGMDKNGFYFWGEKLDMNNLDSIEQERIVYLKEAALRPDTLYSHGIEPFEKPSGSYTEIDFDHFKLKIDATFDISDEKNDSLSIYEDVGEYLTGRILQIKSNNKKDTFHLYIQSIDEVNELIESDSNGIVGSWENWDQFHFTDTSKFFYWKPTTNGNYVFPNLGYQHSSLMQKRIKEFGFTDTTYWYHGEMSGTYFGEAWLYNGKIVDYWIFTAIVKIERHNKGLKDVKYLRLEFSYGC